MLAHWFTTRERRDAASLIKKLSRTVRCESVEMAREVDPDIGVDLGLLAEMFLQLPLHPADDLPAGATLWRHVHGPLDDPGLVTLGDGQPLQPLEQLVRGELVGLCLTTLSVMTVTVTLLPAAPDRAARAAPRDAVQGL